MDDNGPNFRVVDLGLDRPSLREFKVARRMPVFTADGPVIHFGGSIRKLHSAIELIFICCAFAATRAPPGNSSRRQCPY